MSVSYKISLKSRLCQNITLQLWEWGCDYYIIMAPDMVLHGMSGGNENWNR